MGHLLNGKRNHNDLITPIDKSQRELLHYSMAFIEHLSRLLSASLTTIKLLHFECGNCLLNAPLSRACSCSSSGAGAGVVPLLRPTLRQLICQCQFLKSILKVVPQYLTLNLGHFVAASNSCCSGCCCWSGTCCLRCCCCCCCPRALCSPTPYLRHYSFWLWFKKLTSDTCTKDKCERNFCHQMLPIYAHSFRVLRPASWVRHPVICLLLFIPVLLSQAAVLCTARVPQLAAIGLWSFLPLALMQHLGQTRLC